MKHDFEYYWEQIEENFKWNEVYQVMKLLDWTWGIGADASIPSVDMIKKEARSLCYMSFCNKKSYTTGGFSARIDDGEIVLSFVLDEWVAEDY